MVYRLVKGIRMADVMRPPSPETNQGRNGELPKGGTSFERCAEGRRHRDPEGNGDKEASRAEDVLGGDGATTVQAMVHSSDDKDDGDKQNVPVMGSGRKANPAGGLGNSDRALAERLIPRGTGPFPSGDDRDSG